MKESSSAAPTGRVPIASRKRLAPLAVGLDALGEHALHDMRRREQSGGITGHEDGVEVYVQGPKRTAVPGRDGRQVGNEPLDVAKADGVHLQKRPVWCQGSTQSGSALERRVPLQVDDCLAEACDVWKFKTSRPKNESTLTSVRTCRRT